MIQDVIKYTDPELLSPLLHLHFLSGFYMIISKCGASQLQHLL